MNDSKDQVIEIFSGSPWEAEMITTLLRNAEIGSFLKNNVLASYAIEPTFPGGVKVMILASDHEKAKAIVDEYYRNMKI